MTITHRSIIFLNPLIYIDQSAFEGCDQLNYFDFNENIVGIGNNAFANTGLNSIITLPTNLKVLGEHTFDGCTSLIGINISHCSYLNNIPNYLFYRCNQIQGVLELPQNIVSIGDFAFSFCSFSGGIVIPDSVETIGDSAFYECSSFSGSILLGRNLKYIKNRAFYGCINVQGHLNIQSMNLQYIGDYAFYGCVKFNGQLQLPDTIKEIGAYAFSNCNLFTNELNLPNSLHRVGEGAFSQCTGFTGDLVIPENLWRIENTAFFKCTGFEKLIFKGDNHTIGRKAFGSMHFTCITNLPSPCKYKNSEDCYDTDNFESLAKSLNNLLGESCSSLESVTWIIYIVTLASGCGILTFGFNFFWDWYTTRKTWKRRITLIIEDIIDNTKNSSEKADEDSKVLDLIAQLNDRIYIESKEEGFNLTESTVRGILQSSRENHWPTLKMSNHKRIIKGSFNDIEFFVPKKCSLCSKKKKFDNDQDDDEKISSMATLI